MQMCSFRTWTCNSLNGFYYHQGPQYINLNFYLWRGCESICCCCLSLRCLHCAYKNERTEFTRVESCLCPASCQEEAVHAGYAHLQVMLTCRPMSVSPLLTNMDNMDVLSGGRRVLKWPLQDKKISQEPKENKTAGVKEGQVKIKINVSGADIASVKISTHTYTRSSSLHLFILSQVSPPWMPRNPICQL